MPTVGEVSIDFTDTVDVDYELLDYDILFAMATADANARSELLRRGVPPEELP